MIHDKCEHTRFLRLITKGRTLSGQVTTSVSRVQPPHVHQQIDVFATLAGSELHDPSTESGISGILTPDAATSLIHCCTKELLIGGTWSSAGKPRLVENVTVRTS